MSISKKTIKKIVQSIASWADELEYPIPASQLHSDWQVHLEFELEKHKIPVPLSEKNLSQIKSATIDQFQETNKEAVTLHLNTLIYSGLNTISSNASTITTLHLFLQSLSGTSKSLIDQIRSEYNELIGYSKDYEGLEKILKGFEEKLIETCKTSKPQYYLQVDRIIMESMRSDLDTFTETLPEVLKKTTKEQYIEIMGLIEVGVNKLTIMTESEFSVFPEFWLNYYKNYFSSYVTEVWVSKRDEEFGLLQGNFRGFLFSILQKIKNKELIAFDSSICNLQVREAVAEVVLAYIPEEISFPSLILDNFISALQIPSNHFTSDYLRNRAFLDNSVEKFLKNSDQISRFFSLISLVLLLSNTYQFFTDSKILTKEVFSPYIRQVIRVSVSELFQVNYENTLEIKPKVTEWSLVLLCEQEVINLVPGWNVEDDVINMTEYIRHNYDFKERNLADKLDDYSEKVGRSSVWKGVLKATSKIVKSVAPSKRIKEFALEKIKGVSSLSTTIVVSGWLSQDDEMNDSWVNIISNELQGHTLALRWDSGSAQKLVKKELLSSAVHSIGLLVATPIFKVAHLAMLLTVNPFKKRAKKAETTGYVLADLIHSKMLGNACISLVGFSLGTRVIYFCLQRLQELGCQVHDVLLLGGAAPLNVEIWKKCRKTVTGRLINTYSKTDKILSRLYSLSRLEKAIGNWPLEVEGVENFDVTEIASGHLKYRESLDKILSKLEYYSK